MEREELAKVVQSFKFNGRGTGKTSAMLEKAWWLANRGEKVWIVSGNIGSSKVLAGVWLKRFYPLAERTSQYIYPRFVSLNEFAMSIPSPASTSHTYMVLVDPSVLIQLLTDLLRAPEKEDLSKLTPTGWYGVTTDGKVIPFKEPPKDETPKLRFTPEQMKELRDNLVYAGFTAREAVFIVAQVARG